MLITFHIGVSTLCPYTRLRVVFENRLIMTIEKNVMMNVDPSRIHVFISNGKINFSYGVYLSDGVTNMTPSKFAMTLEIPKNISIE